MSGPDTASAVWYIIVLVMVGSALLTQRIPLRSAVGMVLGWVAIFAVVLIGFSYRGEIGNVATRVQSELTGAPRQSVEGSAIRIAMAADGHYWVEGTINGTAARFLIDSGATITALSDQTARAAGLAIDSKRLPVVMQTANGQVEARRATVALLGIGPIHAKDVSVVVSPAFGNVNVIGMNMLSRLKSWRVENGEMVLEP